MIDLFSLALTRFNHFSLPYPSTEMSQDGFGYDWIEDVEWLEKYRPGGYHPVVIGQMVGRYHIVEKLGFGGYSTVWLAWDTLKGGYVALKVGIASADPREMRILRALSIPSAHPGRDAIPSPLDDFVIQGPNGHHPCFTMALAQSDLKMASENYLFPLDVARALVGGLTMAVAYMHSSGYVHGDIHLGNVLVKHPSDINNLSIKQLYEKYGEPCPEPITLRNGKPLPPNVPPTAISPVLLGIRANMFALPNAHVLLGDFGESFPPLSETRLGKDCHTPLGARPPEARFEPLFGLSYSSDIWSLAVAIWSILGMKPLFSGVFNTADDVVCQHIGALGPMPESWFRVWKQTAKKGHRENGWDEWPSIERAFEEYVQKFRRERAHGGFAKEEKTAILSLMRDMLQFQPGKRPTIEEVLASEWMVKWVLPEFERLQATA